MLKKQLLIIILSLIPVVTLSQVILMVQTQKHPPNPPQGGNSILAS